MDAAGIHYGGAGSSDMPLAPQTRIGAFEIQDLLGEGGPAFARAGMTASYGEAAP